LRDFVIFSLHQLRQSRTLHTLTLGPKSGVHFKQVTADGAYDGAPTYQTIAEHGAHIRTVIPPHVTAVLSDEAGSQRDRHIDMIEAKGRLERQKATGYGRRS
jgi:hypothetical protein